MENQRQIVRSLSHPSRDSFELGPGDKTEYGTIIKGLPFGKPFIIEALVVLEKQFSLLEDWNLRDMSPTISLAGDQPEPLLSCKTLGYP